MGIAIAFVVLTLISVVTFNRVAVAATKPPPEVSPDEDRNLYAEALSSSDPYRIEAIADEYYDRGEPGRASQLRAALNHFYEAMSAATPEARTHYWWLVGQGFVGLANRVQTQRPSVLTGAAPMIRFV